MEDGGEGEEGEKGREGKQVVVSNRRMWGEGKE